MQLSAGENLRFRCPPPSPNNIKGFIKDLDGKESDKLPEEEDYRTQGLHKAGPACCNCQPWFSLRNVKPLLFETSKSLKIWRLN